MSDIDLPDGEYTAVVDAIEDGIARVFFEQDGRDVGDSLFDPSQLPPDGRQADAILMVVVQDGDLVDVTVDTEATQQRRESAQDRFDRLSSRPPSDDDS
ncbi:DUF3006 domain-containing protein [Halorubrum sp. BOL3-1]|uniref:DUF3006 domain-containing protein n=1 Tax=Halorubrum sp. BOL3-1 TaxID=2497325 RepID=UPI0010051373|nr:DUF3006 domain-containing protein [Halorubrum sp. BOL3-1]QAU14084.1 DUF3006 domain-containing protein [Halorubrum sp. BOL3-1]